MTFDMKKWHADRRAKAEADGMCRICGRRKPTSGMKSCKPCRQYQRDHRRRKKKGQKSPGKTAKGGLSSEEYARMVESQEGKCLICEREMELVVDYARETGIVRGLLCRHCNIQVGYFESHPERVTAIHDYIHLREKQCLREHIEKEFPAIQKTESEQPRSPSA